jgi:Ni/Co efflux regulator RcnB
MRNPITKVVLAALAVAAALGVQAGQQAATKEPTKAASASHSTSGVVQSVNDNTLVIKHGKEATEMRFELNSQTQREGKIEAGSTVSVRYREEGKTRIATAVTAETKTAQSKSN